jgi:hypothetical protein
VIRNDGEPLGAARVELVPSRLYDTEALAFAYTDGEGAFGPVAIAPGISARGSRRRRVVGSGDQIPEDEVDGCGRPHPIDAPDEA